MQTLQPSLSPLCRICGSILGKGCPRSLLQAWPQHHNTQAQLVSRTGQTMMGLKLLHTHLLMMALDVCLLLGMAMGKKGMLQL